MSEKKKPDLKGKKKSRPRGAVSKDPFSMLRVFDRLEVGPVKIEKKTDRRALPNKTKGERKSDGINLPL